MVRLRNRKERRFSIDSIASGSSQSSADDHSENESVAPKAQARSQQATSEEQWSELMQKLVADQFDIPMHEVTLCDLLNLCFELSGFPAELYETQDYISALETECYEIIDSSLERAGDFVIQATSPLMHSLRSYVRTHFVEHEINRCFNVANELLRDVGYTPRLCEFLPTSFAGADREVKTAARLIEATLKQGDYTDTLAPSAKSTSQEKKCKNIATNLKLLLPSVTDIDSLTAKSLRNWLVLFATSNLQILRVTGTYMLFLMCELYVDQCSDTIRRLCNDRLAAEKDLADLDDTLNFLFDTACVTFKDRVADINILICHYSLKGLRVITQLGEPANVESFVDCVTHTALRHPSALVRASAISDSRSLCEDLVKSSRQPLRKLNKSLKSRLSERVQSLFPDDRSSVVMRLVDTILIWTVKFALDPNLLVSWTCIDYFRWLFDTEAKERDFHLKDVQVTNIVSLVFTPSIVRLPHLPLLGSFIDRSVFTHTIIERGATSMLVGPEIVYSTLIQFLTDYADDAQWIPYHHNVIKAFYAQSPFCRDLVRLWQFVNVVYRPAALRDLTQQYDWLTKPKAADTLLFIVQAIWNVNEISKKNLPLYSTTDQEQGILISSSHNALTKIRWTQDNAVLPETLIHTALQEDFINILQRARQHHTQFLKALSLLYNVLVLHEQLEDSSSSVAYKSRVSRLDELLLSFLSTIHDPLELHSVLLCLQKTSGASFYSHYSKQFQDLIKSAQKHLKSASTTNALITESNQPSPRSAPAETMLKIIAVDPINRDTLRNVLILIRVFIYNDTNFLICDKLEFLDDLLNYIQICVSHRTWDENAITAHSDPLSMVSDSPQFPLVDLQLVINCLDIVWLAQAKLMERLCWKFDNKILPVATIQTSTPLDHLSVSTSGVMQSDSSAKDSADHISYYRLFNEDLEIYKEMNLQLSCYLAQFSDKCRQITLSHRLDPRLEGSRIAKQALLCSLQCCRLLCANSIFQSATKLWPHLRLVMQKLPRGSEEMEGIKQSISKHALGCFIPRQAGPTTEIAYFLDSMKQVYAQKRRQVESFFNTHSQLRWGFLDQFVGNIGHPIGPNELWDVYKNLTPSNLIAEFLDPLDLENMAFIAQSQLTVVLSNIPDKSLWKGSSIGPVIIAYVSAYESHLPSQFRSKSIVLRQLASKFIEKCLEYDEAAEGNLDDPTDRPLLISLVLSTLQTLLRRALETDNSDKIGDVEAMATDIAEQLPKNYWKSLTNTLFMNFMWMTIQRAYTCDSKGVLLDLMSEYFLNPRSIPKRYSKTEANTQVEALKTLAKDHYRQSSDWKVEEIFMSRLLRFIRICLPTANLPDEKTFSAEWPPFNAALD